MKNLIIKNMRRKAEVINTGIIIDVVESTLDGLYYEIEPETGYIISDYKSSDLRFLDNDAIYRTQNDNIWVVRDYDGTLKFYNNCPVRDTHNKFWVVADPEKDNWINAELLSNFIDITIFSHITWEMQPQRGRLIMLLTA